MNVLVSWDDSLSVNIGEIDSQHKQLVSMINALHTAMKKGQGKEMTTHLVSELKKYAQKHFTTEEKYLEIHGYPELAGHRVEHEKFIEKVLDFELAYQEGRAPLTMEVMTFLKDWLVKHIKGTDKKYGPFLNDKGIK